MACTASNTALCTIARLREAQVGPGKVRSAFRASVAMWFQCRTMSPERSVRDSSVSSQQRLSKRLGWPPRVRIDIIHLQFELCPVFGAASIPNKPPAVDEILVRIVSDGLP